MILIAELYGNERGRCSVYLEGFGFQAWFDWIERGGDAWYRRDEEKRWGVYKRDGELAVFAGRLAGTMNRKEQPQPYEIEETAAEPQPASN